jgi:uncharacterized LabA/DUF88 family protein
VSEERLKIAVFIDFDNIEIGVKTTLGQHFDVGSVLESIKERGEIVSKSAYGDWTRAGDYGRAMSQNAIHMVQRNLTPGGDKNGADINLALDALEMAFTHSHINTFVIVGGDSDFISLVEKLKQYDRKVFVVGGRQFTSLVMQKNCTEFLAYENLVGRGRPAPRGTRPTGGDLSQAMPLVRRALKLLADREVLPQLGLLKSTLLQLDSAFSERDYGASSFRDFVQKLANAGHVNIKGTDRSFHVELREGTEGHAAMTATPVAPAERTEAPPRPAAHQRHAPAPAATPAPPPAEPLDAAPEPAAEADEAPVQVTDGTRQSPADAVRLFQQAVAQAKTPPRWPLYVRQVKQLVKAIEPQFDERQYGFAGIVDALRFAQREGVFRIERDRLGVVRIFPGQATPRVAGEHDATTEPMDVSGSGSPVGSIEPAGIEIGQSPVAAPSPRRETVQLPMRYVQVTGPSDSDTAVTTGRTGRGDVAPAGAEAAAGGAAEASGDVAAPTSESRVSHDDGAGASGPGADADRDEAAQAGSAEQVAFATDEPEAARVLPRRRRQPAVASAAGPKPAAARKPAGGARKKSAAAAAEAPAGRGSARSGRSTKRAGGSES